MSSRRGWEGPLGFFIDGSFIVAVLAAMLVVGGLVTSPFRWSVGDLPQSPVPVDAIPDTGENQQIVFTEWPGRSPKDIEDQVTYPLTAALLGIGGVKTIRSSSMFGLSSVYVIFDEEVGYYAARSRILEKLASLPSGTLPDGVSPSLGPDATPLGQVFWYTLEGRDAEGRPAPGWDQQELRTIQDWTVRYALQAVPGVSEVASVGGYVREYQVDIDPEALLAYHVGVDDVARAVAQANLDVGARTAEINRVEYVVRGLGFIKSIADLEAIVVANREHTPVHVGDVAKVHLGPAQRRGALDVEGAPAVGGVVVIRYGANPLEVIEAVKAKLSEIEPGLPRRALEDGRQSRVTVVPFYDRTELIEETLGTLSTALWQQLLITVVVVLVMLRRLRSALLVCLVLPFAVLGTFILMRTLSVDANIMALSGVAIAIGSMVDMGIVLTESITDRWSRSAEPAFTLVRRAAAEVAPAVVTSTATTIVSFIPVFGLTASEGKLFRPLAFTKTFAMFAALTVALIVLPAVAAVLLRRHPRLERWAARFPAVWAERARVAVLVVLVAVVAVALADDWSPLGLERGVIANRLFTLLLIGLLLGGMSLFVRVYPRLIDGALRRPGWILGAAALSIVWGVVAWRGVPQLTEGWPDRWRRAAPVAALARALPGLGREYMPPLDEGAFLYMPTTMPHASIGQAQEQLAMMDAAIASVPEVKDAVGKLGRVDSALDPAPISMFETVVTIVPEYGLDPGGNRVRQWRDHIRTTDDIWNEIREAAQLPGVTDAPRLQPIAARLVMLQSGMRAPMGLKIRGPDLARIEAFGREVEAQLRRVPSVRPETVVADRIVGKPYLEIDIDRRAIARHGLSVAKVQEVIQTAIGGQTLTHTVEGRERYPVRVRYKRERRAAPDGFGEVLVPSPLGHQLPLEQLADIRYARGPQVIKSEDTFLTGYVVFDKQSGVAEVDVVEEAQRFLEDRITSGELEVPPGVSYSFAGAYQNQVRSEARLKVLVPAALALVVLLIYLQFRRASTTLIIASSVLLAASGGFLLLWLYGKPWFLDASVGELSLREVFRVGPQNISVAVWVGFIALAGIATDDAVLMTTYLRQRFDETSLASWAEIRAAAAEAAVRRVRPCVMTTATTLLALLPVVTATGRGSDVMLPMALPLLGGMTVALGSLFLVPVLFALREARSLAARVDPNPVDEPAG